MERFIADLNLSMLFMVSNFLSTKMSSEWRLNPGFGTQNVLFLNRGVPSIEDKILYPLSGGVP